MVKYMFMLDNAGFVLFIFLTTLLLLLLISTSPTHGIYISESSSTCGDPLFDTCSVTFSFTSSEVRSSNYTIPLPSWLPFATILTEYTTNGKQCGYGNDKNTLMIKEVVKDTTSITCFFQKIPNSITPSTTITLVDPASTFTFPALVYYDQPFDLVPVDDSCENMAFNGNCEAIFYFPTPAIPFTLSTTSYIPPTSLKCYDINLNPVPLGTGISLKQRGSVGTDGLYKYEITWGTSPQSYTSTPQINCQASFSKPGNTPYFYAHSSSYQYDFFKSSAIVYSDVSISPYLGDCGDKSSNTCTLIFEVPFTSLSFVPTGVWATGFASVINHEQVPCPSYITQGLPQTSMYFCQTYTKFLQTVTTAPFTGIQTISAAVKSNTVLVNFPAIGKGSISADNSNRIIRTFDTSIITFTTPLTYEWDEASCIDVTSPYCPLKIKSLHSGPNVSVTMTLPYTGQIDPDNIICSQYASFDAAKRTFSLPGSLKSNDVVPHPRDVDGDSSGNAVHWCKIMIVKRPMESYPLPTVNRISSYDLYPSFHTSLLHSDSALTSVAIPNPFKRLPVDLDFGGDCTDRDLEWCTITFTPTKIHTLKDFSFSTVGITTPTRDADWELSYELADSSFFEIDIVRSETVYYHPGETDAGNSLGLSKNCNVGAESLPRCRDAPAQISLPYCVPECDFTKPDDLSNPCSPCSEDIELFTVKINGIVDQPFIFKFRKLVWRTHYRNVLYFYSYRDLSYADGVRVGTGDLDLVTWDPVLSPATTDDLITVLDYNPDFAVTFNNCDLENILTCVGTVSRRETSTVYLFYTLDQSTFFGELPTVYPAKVFDMETQSTLWIQMTPLPNVYPYDTFKDFPTLLPKRLGINQISHTYKFNVLPCPDDVILTEEEAAGNMGCSYGKTQFSHMVAFEGDALPTFASDCKEASSETCTITYKIHSDITAFTQNPIAPGPGTCYENPEGPECWTPFTIIKHWIPHRSAIYSFDLSPRYPTKDSYKGTTTRLFPGANLRDYTNMYDLRYEPTCDGENFDELTKVEVRWSDGCLTAAQNGGVADTACTQIKDPQGNYMGMLELVLVSGEIPLGGTCKVVMTKRSTTSSTKRFRTLPLVLYNQPQSSFEHIKPSHYITFPIIGYTRIKMVGRDDCTTQSVPSIVCTIDIKFAASPTNPLNMLWIRVPSTLQHPLILVSPEPYYIMKTVNGVVIKVGQVTVTDAPTAMVVSGDEVGYNNGDDEMFFQHSNITPSNTLATLDTTQYPPRDLTIILYDEWRYTDFECELVLRAPNNVGTPIPFSMFNVVFFLNGYYGSTNSKTMPVINFPDSITGTLFYSNFNVTSSSNDNPWVNIEFGFYYNKILKITIDQDFGGYNPILLPSPVKTSLASPADKNFLTLGEDATHSWFDPTLSPPDLTTPDMKKLNPHQYDIPCYNSRPQDIRQSERIPYSLYQRRYESSQGSSLDPVYNPKSTDVDEVDNRREIIAWIRSHPITKKSVLVPVDSSQMAGKRCYTYFKSHRDVNLANVEHNILVVGNNPTTKMNVKYFTSYPPHSTDSKVLAITTKGPIPNWT